MLNFGNLCLWLYCRPVDRELARNLLVDRSRRQVDHPWRRRPVRWSNTACWVQINAARRSDRRYDPTLNRNPTFQFRGECSARCTSYQLPGRKLLVKFKFLIYWQCIRTRQEKQIVVLVTVSTLVFALHVVLLCACYLWKVGNTAYLCHWSAPRLCFTDE